MGCSLRRIGSRIRGKVAPALDAATLPLRDDEGRIGTLDRLVLGGLALGVVANVLSDLLAQDLVVLGLNVQPTESLTRDERHVEVGALALVEDGADGIRDRRLLRLALRLVLEDRTLARRERSRLVDRAIRSENESESEKSCHDVTYLSGTWSLPKLRTIPMKYRSRWEVALPLYHTYYAEHYNM